MAEPDSKFLSVAPEPGLWLLPGGSHRLPVYCLIMCSPTPLGTVGTGHKQSPLEALDPSLRSQRMIRSELERTTKMLFKRRSLPWGRKGEVGNVRGGLVALMPGGGGGGTTGMLNCPSLHGRVSQRIDPLKMPTAPSLKNSGTFHSSDEEIKGRSSWGRKKGKASLLGGKFSTRNCSADPQARARQSECCMELPPAHT